MAIAGNAVHAYRIEWFDKASRIIAITHGHHAQKDAVESSAYAAVVKMDAEGFAWVKATETAQLRQQGYTVKSIQELML